MQISKLKISPAAIEAGEWKKNLPEMGDLELKVRGIGNADYRKMQAELIRALPKSTRRDSALSIDEADRINSTLLAETVLLDWRGLEGADGKAIPYSKEFAAELLTAPEYLPFREAVSFASATVGEDVAANLEADAKN